MRRPEGVLPHRETEVHLDPYGVGRTEGETKRDRSEERSRTVDPGVPIRVHVRRRRRRRGDGPVPRPPGSRDDVGVSPTCD